MNSNGKKAPVQAILGRGHIQEVISDQDISELLSGPPLRVKWGTDPTSKNIHLGRSIPIMLLRDLQQLGHQIVVIIGNFTAEIGDTSDKDCERPAISTEAVIQNMQTYIQQIGQILDLDKTEFHFNKDWWGQMDFSRFVRITDLFSLAEFSARNNIAKRLREGKRVSIREMIYPIMQGYDSLHLDADIEIGGTDQKFNMLAGRTIQRAHGKKAQSLIMTTLIEGLDGRKMSSSWGNTINLTDSPDDMLGKLMSMKDEMIIPYYIHLTRVPREVIDEFTRKMSANEVNPRDVKLELAVAIVSDLYSSDLAEKAAAEFKKVFQQRELPEDMPSFQVKNTNIVDVLLEIGFAGSRSAARRLIEQGGVRIDDAKVSELSSEIPNQCVIRKGKLHFAKVEKV